MEYMLTLIGLIFFIAVGYFAYNFGQCIGKFSRLDKFINQKIFGVGLLVFYVFFVYTNQEAVITAFLSPIK